MKKLTKKFALVLLGIPAFVSWTIYARATKASKPQVWTPGCVALVPRAWGVYRGGSAQSGLAFEDSAGTLRFLTNIPCGGTPVVSLEIRRSANSNGNE
jgi:hypothetical protein